MRAENIPEVVILRLPHYARVLSMALSEGRELVSSQELGERLHITPAQIRKDLSYFGRFGRQGRGYNVRRLLQMLRQILGLDREWPLILVGVGRLGRAVLSYPGFAPEGFRVVAAFDSDPDKIGRRIGPLVIQPPSQIPETVARLGVLIAILTVPAAAAQEVADLLIASGVKAILNYAPVTLKVPEGVLVRDIDPVSVLQSLTYYLKDLPIEPRTLQPSLTPGALFRPEP